MQCTDDAARLDSRQVARRSRAVDLWTSVFREAKAIKEAWTSGAT